MSTTREYVVNGMTCEHCQRSIIEEVSDVAGVETVDVDLASGRVVVNGEGFSDQAVAAAVQEAGYELTTA